MSRLVRTKEWGVCELKQGRYVDEYGPHAIWLERQGEMIAKISVNVEGKSEKLPENCFYLKWWGENYIISMDVVESGWVKVRDEFPLVSTGNIKAIPTFELLDEQMPFKKVKRMIENWTVLLEKEQ